MLLFLSQNVRALTPDRERELIERMLTKGAFACSAQETRFLRDADYTYGEHMIMARGGKGRGTGVAMMLSPQARKAVHDAGNRVCGGRRWWMVTECKLCGDGHFCT